MNKISLAVGFIALLASSANAEIYHCKLKPNLTRGWAPANMYLDTEKSVLLTGDEDIKVSKSGSSYFWRMNLRARNGGYFQVRYTLRVGSGIGPQNPVPSSLNIRVKGNQDEDDRGTCEVYTG
ncbi:MAG: hypothetical protein AAGI10_06260 [Pseudomonadota bacterium]